MLIGLSHQQQSLAVVNWITIFLSQPLICTRKLKETRVQRTRQQLNTCSPLCSVYESGHSVQLVLEYFFFPCRVGMCGLIYLHYCAVIPGTCCAGRFHGKSGKFFFKVKTRYPCGNNISVCFREWLRE